MIVVVCYHCHASLSSRSIISPSGGSTRAAYKTPPARHPIAVDLVDQGLNPLIFVQGDLNPIVFGLFLDLGSSGKSPKLSNIVWGQSVNKFGIHVNFMTL
jgi:hypothetical protein